jgi:hypothetical protein
MWRCVNFKRGLGASEDDTASISPEDEASKFPRNIVACLPEYTVSYPEVRNLDSHRSDDLKAQVRMVT